MCMQDWRVGRLIRTLPTLTGIAGGVITLNQNRQRVGILVSSPDTPDPLNVDVIIIAVENGPQVGISMENLPYLISLTTHGDMPTRLVSVQSINGNINLSATEFVMPEEYLAAGLEQFISEYARWKQ